MNEIIKKQYIESLSSNKAKRDNMIDVFNIAAELEEQLQKDCGFFTQAEIKCLMEKMLVHKQYATKQLESQVMERSCKLLKDYVMWLRKYHQAHYARYEDYVQMNRTEVINVTADSLDMNKLYSQEEVYDLIDGLLSVYDKMFLLAMFEGLYSEDTDKRFFQINLAACHPEDNTVHLVDGTVASVSNKMMQLLLDGGNNTSDRFISIAPGVLERDPSLCFKRLNILPDFDKDRINNIIPSYRQNVKRSLRLEKDTKFRAITIRWSGFFYTLFQAGITEHLNDLDLYKEGTPARKIADRYSMPLKRNKKRFQLTVESYMKDTE